MINSVFLTNSDERGVVIPHFIFGDEMYSDLEYTINYFKRIHDFTFDFVDIRNGPHIVNMFKQS